MRTIIILSVSKRKRIEIATPNGFANAKCTQRNDIKLLRFPRLISKARNDKE